MLENSFRLTFFLKKPKNESFMRIVYLRVTVDGIARETSTKQKWDVRRWDQETCRATGNKEDARTINFYLDTLTNKILQFKSELIMGGHIITAQRLIDYVLGNDVSRATLIQEFQKHNDELLVLVKTGDFAIGTHKRYRVSKGHLEEFVRFKYNREDIEFRELRYEFIADFEFYLRTVKGCNNNTTLKHITHVRKMVTRALHREIIPKDPFISFKGKKNKVVKTPLSQGDLTKIENHEFETRRLSVVRDVFVFQCYTGLAYIDVFNLRQVDICTGIDGKLWISKERQKTANAFHVPLLPKALQIIESYKDDPIAHKRGKVLPVASNQKMNEYLKEIAAICGITETLNTHKARRTFGSTVTLANGVPIHVVKEMLGHQSVKQTEEYALTERQAIGKEMDALQIRLNKKSQPKDDSSADVILKMQQEILELKTMLGLVGKAS